MEEIIKQITSNAALAIESAAAIIIVAGAAKCFYRCLILLANRHENMMDARHIWLHFGRWLILGLEFELAADILRTAISPTWTQLGQLAAIAAIRTVLNYFLERDIEKIVEDNTRETTLSSKKNLQKLPDAA